MEILDVYTLLSAYSAGVFPMALPEEGNAIYWFEPKQRGIMPLDGFKLSKTLKKKIEQQTFEVRLNHDFEAVIKACADRAETWISDEIMELYVQLHHMGFAHSIECYQNNQLVGGLYGVAIKKAFFGESMFHRVTDASKVAFYYLVEWLNENNFLLLDMQYLTPHLQSLGGIEISKAEYLKRLKKALK